jgi:hypothetical protein
MALAHPDKHDSEIRRMPTPALTNSAKRKETDMRSLFSTRGALVLAALLLGAISWAAFQLLLTLITLD